MKEILKLNAISKVADNAVAGKFTLVDKSNEPLAIMLRSFNMHDYEIPSSVLCVGRAGAGVNNIPIDKCSERGIAVFNTPGANANAVKELAVLSLLLASRDAYEGANWAATLTGSDVAKQVETGKKAFAGRECYGKTVGVIGLGAIGVLVANACASLGMHVLGYDPFLSVNNALNLDRTVAKTESLDELFAHSDYITMHTPLVDGTRGLINAAALEKMKDGVAIVNLSRGELAVNADVIAAVESGKVKKYVTDFAAPELLGKKNIIVLPHLGASTEEAEDNCATMAAHELCDYINEGVVNNSVNFPAFSQARTAPYRIAVVHKNVKKVISTISDTIAADNINIESLFSQAKNDLAYTVLDIKVKPSAKLIEKIAKADNVVSVRAIGE